MLPFLRTIAAAALLLATGVNTVAAEIKVMSAGAVQSMVEALGSEFAKASGHKLNLNFGTVGSLAERLKNGEKADLVILSRSAITELNKTGMFLQGSVHDLGRTVTGIAIKEGAPEPDVSTEEKFKQALLKAKTISYTDPSAGGSSGTMFAKMLEDLGIADVVAKKTVFGKRGYEVAQAVADGRAEIGTTFISEILTVKGVTVVGPLPGKLHNVNTYTAAIPASASSRDAAAALLRALTDPATAPRWTKAGLEPAFLN
jgi:molybdate transport system substrate-binding protein